MTALKPCPFCNSRLDYIESNCGEPVAQHPHSDSCVLSRFYLWGSEPIAAWNRRALSQPQAGEAVGYVTPDSIAEVAAGRIGNHLFPKGTLHPENEIPVYASPQPASPAQVTDAMVEMLAEFLCSEFDEDFNPCHGYSWPEHKDDDGYRGGNAYVKLQPSDVQARAREGATRILMFLSQRAALTAAIGAGGQAVAEDAREALRELANVKMDISLEDWCRISNTILRALRAPSPSPPGVVEALRGAHDAFDTIAECAENCIHSPGQMTNYSTAKYGMSLVSTALASLSQPHPADERVVEALREARELLAGPLVGVEWKRACRSFIEKADAALAQEGR